MGTTETVLTDQQRAIALKAQELLSLLNDTIPENVFHWAVDGARQSMWSLAARAHTIHTCDWVRTTS